jgi:hypothetical protein
MGRTYSYLDTVIDFYVREFEEEHHHISIVENKKSRWAIKVKKK